MSRDFEKCVNISYVSLSIFKNLNIIGIDKEII